MPALRRAGNGVALIGLRNQWASRRAFWLEGVSHFPLR
jgi:hypothetical protein